MKCLEVHEDNCKTMDTLLNITAVYSQRDKYNMIIKTIFHDLQKLKALYKKET